MALSGAPARTELGARSVRRSAKARRRRGGGSLTHPARTGWLLVTPALLFVGVFVLAPLVFAIYISLTNWLPSVSRGGGEWGRTLGGGGSGK